MYIVINSSLQSVYHTELAILCGVKKLSGLQLPTV